MATVTRGVDDRLEKIAAKIEKKTIGTTKLSINAARSRRKFIQPVFKIEPIIRAGLVR